MSRLIDITGQKFNKLLVIKLSHTSKTGTFWVCKCDCGNTKIIKGTLLKRGTTKSCGCLKKVSSLNNLPKATHGLTNNRFYRTWIDMLHRCYDIKRRGHKDYGGRGITVCDEWLYSPIEFIKWCEEQNPTTKLELDRKDNDKGYYPDNCRFVTRSIQNRNKRDNIWISYNREQVILKDLVNKYKIIKYGCVVSRIFRGWDPITAALTPPTRSHNSKSK